MTKQFDGYVIYCKDLQKRVAWGIVSENYDCKAKTYYVPRRAKDFLVQIEDQRFYKHKGIDIKGMVRATLMNIRSGRIVQGGSTISQQLARNLLKDKRITIKRKVKEIIKTFQIERCATKEEILDLYFDNVFFGKNLWGIRAASLYYFGKEVELISEPEILYLLTILRGPNYYLLRENEAIKRYKLINDILHKTNRITERRIKKNLTAKIILKNEMLKLVKRETIPFILEYSNDKKNKIISTIDFRTQSFCKEFVLNSKYPVSIVALKEGKVIGFESSYGTDYPFISKSNVGSTLKPFIYCFLRSRGVSKFEEFDSVGNGIENWSVREVITNSPILTLGRALFYSNNNVFINASEKIGIENVLNFLSELFGRSHYEFYPSSILGVTKGGISLYELAYAYNTFFSTCKKDQYKKECLEILHQVFYEKLEFDIECAFLKTGTTNNNKERYAVLGDSELTFAVLRNENPINDDSKEGGFLNQLSKAFSIFFSKKREYKWI